MSLQIHLTKFEGPMGLLLHLIREQEMDIFDIDIAKITQQYLDYIRTMKSLDLELAGDFVAMAATLLQIKSRMLLPQYNDEGEPVEGDDPRKELVQKLMEYQKYQEASKLLAERPWLGRDVWVRGERLDVTSEPDDEVIVEDNPLFALISSYRHVIRSMKSGIHKVVGALQSISGRILEMKERLIVGQRVGFQTLITAPKEQRSSQILVTFLSLLELAKMGFVSLFQTESFSEIHIDTKKVIDRDVLSNVESYDNVHSAQVADAMMHEPLAADLPVQTELELLNSEPEVLELPIVESGPAATPYEFESATDEEIEAEEQRLAQLETGEVEAASEFELNLKFSDPIEGGAT